MPNHITNKLYVIDSGSHSKLEIIKSCLDGEGHFDFNKIIPLDERFQDSEFHSGIIGRAKAAMGVKEPFFDAAKPINETVYIDKNFSEEEKKEAVKNEINNIIKSIELYRDTGYFYWYDAQCYSWGTKWNAYDQPENGYSGEEEYIQFDTAWCTPEPIFKALSEKFPDATFKIIFADEDTGSNCGTFSIKNGEVIEENIAPSWRDQSEEDKEKWTKFAYEVKGWDYEEYLREKEQD